MAEANKSAVREVLEDEAAGWLDFIHARTLAYSISGEMDKLKALVAESEETFKSSRSPEARALQALRAGAGRWIMRQFDKACEDLEPVADQKEGAYMLGLCRMELGQYDEAFKSFKTAAKGGQDEFACAMGEAEALRLSGRCEESMARIRQFQKSHDHEAELHYQKGRCLEYGGDYEAASEAYQRVIELNPQHPGALFRLAYWNDLRGNDDVAVDLYEKAAAIPPARAGVLLNLGILYEDHGEYKKAAVCFEKVHAACPESALAKMYYKDAVSSLDMYYDETIERRPSRTAMLLQTPLEEFELSARARSCLEQMDIRTLADLARLSEEDLSGSKNMGETTLTELRDLLRTKGLHFGMSEELTGPRRVRPALTAGAGAENMDKPIADMDLSIRCQKCMQTLNIRAVGELAQRTEKELLQCQNFGQTSLNEIKLKLESMNLSLKGRS